MFLFPSIRRELRTRIRYDNQVLLKTIRESVELLQQARSASATPALGFSLHLVMITRPHPMDIREDMEEVNKQLQTFSLTPSAVKPSPASEPLSPATPNQLAQKKVMEVSAGDADEV